MIAHCDTIYQRATILGAGPAAVRIELGRSQAVAPVEVPVEDATPAFPLLLQQSAPCPRRNFNLAGVVLQQSAPRDPVFWYRISSLAPP